MANLYCDNGTEYLSNEFKDYCKSKGIQYHLTVPKRILTERARVVARCRTGKESVEKAVVAAVHT